jgi:protein phosphatase
MNLRLKTFGLSDIGLTRPNNEDVWVSLPEIGFFALADGMGGHQAGEVAAKEALDHLCYSAKEIKSVDCVELMIELKTAIQKANEWVYRLGKKSESLNGMGTTLCCLIWNRDTIVYAHVGDSRIYRLRGQKLELLTRDHSLLAKWLATGKLAEDCETPFPYKNVITRAIGTAARTKPEIAASVHVPGDLYFLCTDGLSDVLSLEEIEIILNQSPDLELAAQRLIERAKIKGSSDNMTLLIIQSEIENGPDLPGQ